MNEEKRRYLQKYSKRELLLNWLSYNKWWLVLALAVLIAVARVVVANVTQVRPDYQIAYVGDSPLPDDTVAALEAALGGLGGDLNGDGRVAVRLHQYVSTQTGDGAAMQAAASTQLNADILDCESYFFLLEDPEGFQRSYHTLCRLDGTLPEDGDYSVDEVCLPWAQCPVLTGLELGEYTELILGRTVTGSSQELLSRLYIARRGFWTEKTAAYPEGCTALWDKLKEGAVS